MAEQLLVGFLLSAALALVSLRVRFLSNDGAVAQLMLGTLLLGLGGWRWAVPIIVFFLTSSTLSRLWKDRRAGFATIFEKSSVRDAAQVIANGGVAGAATLLWLVTRDETLYVACVGAVAAATADTWATEIGTLSRSAPVLITTLKTVERGRSGAVSWLGTLAALLGSALIALSAMPWIHDNVRATHVAAVVCGGFAGMLADSLAGATVQRTFRCAVCRQATERRVHCGVAAERVAGIAFVTNDVVNLLCTLVGAATAAAVSLL